MNVVQQVECEYEYENLKRDAHVEDGDSDLILFVGQTEVLLEARDACIS